VFYDAGNPEARRAGGILYEDLSAAMSAFSADWVGTVFAGATARLNANGEDLYGLHRYTPGIPSVITEAGYLTNASEAALFARQDVLEAQAHGIADGIVRWLTTNDPGSGFVPEFVDGSSSGTGGIDNCTDPQLG
jgi:hypothetical protein